MIKALRVVGLTALYGLAVAAPAPSVSTTSPSLPVQRGINHPDKPPQGSQISPPSPERHVLHTKIVRSVVTVHVTKTVNMPNVVLTKGSSTSSSTVPTAVSTTVSTTTSAPKAAITIGAGYWVTAYANGAILRAPLDCHGQNTYLGVKKYADGAFDAGRCVEVCRNDEACHFVNTWMLRSNGTVGEQHCALYAKEWPNQFLVDVGNEVAGIEATDSYG